MKRSLRLITAAALCAMASLAHAEVQEQMSQRTYRVDLPEGQALAGAIDAASPVARLGTQRLHSETEWDLQWHYSLNEDKEGRCSLSSVRTTLNMVVVLPELGQAPESARLRFDQHLQALRRYESGHQRIARDAARRLELRLRELVSAPTCLALEQRVNQVGYREIDAARQEQGDYDRQTRFGRNLGAWFER